MSLSPAIFEKPIRFSLNRFGVIPAIIFSQFLVVLPLFKEVSLWIIITSMAAIIWRLGNHFRDWKLPGRWNRLLIGMMGAAAVIYEHNALFTKDAGLSLFVVMSCLRMLELNRFRDGMNSLFLAFFLLSINFLYSQSILMALYALFTTFWLLLSLHSLQSIDGLKAFKRSSKITAKIFLVVLPLTVILFLFFPRLSHPLWRMPGNVTAGSGVSDSMTPGDISSLTLGEEIAFRVKFMNEAPPSNQLYWRGLVLSEFDGLTWNRGEPQANGKLEITGESIEYTVYLEPHKRSWLFFLDMPVKQKKTAYIDLFPNEQYTNELPDKLYHRMQYKGFSYANYNANLNLNSEVKEYYLQLPSRGNQRSKDWAEALREGVESDEAFITKILQYIHQKPFRYTLTPDILQEEGIDDFWFNTQNGFCEHYASNLVFMARAAGIPARIVIGYQGGEKNPYNDNWIVRQANAHAWTEIWLEGEGWKRIDPTAAIHPSRVEKDASRSYRQRDSLFDATVFGEWLEDKGMLQDFRFMWDAMNSSWQKWVIDFDNDSQGELMKWVGFKDYSWATMLRIILISVGITLFFWFFSTLGPREKMYPSVELYRRLCRKLEVLGFARNLNEGPQDYLQRMELEHSEWIEFAAPIVKNYIDFRFREIEPDVNNLKILSRKVSKIKKVQLLKST